MNWDEKVIALPPIAVTSAYLGVGLLGVLSTEALPIGSVLSWVSFGLTALASFALIFAWIGALHSLVIKRLPDFATRLAKGRGIFRSAIGWTILWCCVGSALPYLPDGAFAALMILTFMAGYFTLSAVWATTSAMLAFEKSDNAFQTFVQIAFFPIGVWLLQPRLKRILSTDELSMSPA